MYEAGACAGTLLDLLNKELGTDYQPHQVLKVTQQALEANTKTGDFAAARFLRDIDSGKYELSTPGDPECREAVIDGEKEILFSGRGTILIIYLCWREEQTPKARQALLRYCQYIALHGFPGGATKALAQLDGLRKEAAMEWIRKTYARYVADDRTLIQFVLGRL